jgi:hypothetical protein
MFRISIIEVSFVCLVALLLLVVPLVYRNAVTRINARLDELEKKVNGK